MDYEQRYKEALDEAKAIHKAIKQDLKPVIEQIFPELKELDDEEIRKWIIDDIRYNMNNEPLNDSKYKKKAEKAIAWLEKQGEQKPVDKVESKFKDGQWIVFNGLTLYINEVVKGYYRTISKGGTPNSYDWNIDNAARLWTIQDAKDGDVLFHSDSASNGIFIFKELLKYEFGEKVICYCDYDSEDHFCLGEHHTCCWADAKILHPATKEQRETLFEKMKLEGYRWDEDEKKVIQFERFVRRKESDFAFKEDENGVIKFVHKKN